MPNRAHLSICTTVLAATLGLSAPNVSAADYSVDINKTEIIRVPGTAAAVVVGNPEIADVSVHSTDTLFILGRSYGETNLIILDSSGQTIMNADIAVSYTAPQNTVQLLNIGEGLETYSCNPQCLPAPVLGNTDAFRGANEGEATPINNSMITASPTNGGTMRSAPQARAPQQLSGPPR